MGLLEFQLFDASLVVPLSGLQFFPDLSYVEHIIVSHAIEHLPWLDWFLLALYVGLNKLHLQLKLAAVLLPLSLELFNLAYLLLYLFPEGLEVLLFVVLRRLGSFLRSFFLDIVN